MRRVVITGLGAITAVGEGAASLWEAAKESRSGIDFIQFGGPQEWNAIGAQIHNFEPEKYITQRKSLKVMARDIQLAVSAASLALDDSGARDLSFNPDLSGVIVSSGVLNHELDELAFCVQGSMDPLGKLDLKKFGENGISSLFPLWLLKYLPNMPACHISILFDLRGMNNTITAGGSGGLQAAGEAFRVIQRGDADLMLAGGAESKTNPVGLSEYKILGAFQGDSQEDPKRQFRPFHPQAGGFVAGEGAGFLVLEELTHARKRGARIYAEIAGFGSSFRDGQADAMRAALRDAKSPPSDIDYVQAAGIGIASDDEREAKAIREVLGANGQYFLVSASKPVTGFTGFAAGALDLIISTMAVSEQRVAPLLNFDPSAQALGFEVAADKAAPHKIHYAMTNAFGFNGQAASMVTQKFKG